MHLDAEKLVFAIQITIQGADPVKPPQTWQFVPVLKD